MKIELNTDEAQRKLQHVFAEETGNSVQVSIVANTVPQVGCPWDDMHDVLKRIKIALPDYRNGQKIAAIKMLRELAAHQFNCSMSLLSAKELIQLI